MKFEEIETVDYHDHPKTQKSTKRFQAKGTDAVTIEERGAWIIIGDRVAVPRERVTRGFLAVGKR